MQWYGYVLIVLASLLALFIIFEIAISLYLIYMMTFPKSRSYEDALKLEFKLKKLTQEQLDNYYKFETFNVKSRYGYNLKAYYIPKKKDVKFKDGKERVIILAHGWTALAQTMFAYGKIYLEKGFHVFAIDHVNHGLSDKAKTTMGDKEADDLQTLIEMVFEKIGYNTIIGLQGESMGSATCMINAGRYHSVNFVCEDCGYSDLQELSKYILSTIKFIPSYPTIYIAKLFYYLRCKRNIKYSSPIKYLQTLDDIPVYFTHGAKDDFVPTYMAYKCYDAKPGKKKIYIFENAGHARSLAMHTKAYADKIYEFLYEIEVIDQL